MNHFVLIFLIVTYCTRSIFCSDSIFKGNLKDNSFPNENVGNIGKILLNKRFVHDIGFDDGRGIFGKIDRKFGFDDGNPDIHGRIKRPCQAYDTFCIRKFFAERSKCKISGNRLPDPFFRAQSTYNYPSSNTSVTNLNYVYQGLNNARVQEFYINEATDNLVIAVKFDSVLVLSNDTNIMYFLRGREPEVHKDVATITFVGITITLIIPGLDDLRLDRAEVYTYADAPFFPFAAGPRLPLSTNPEVLAMFVNFATIAVPSERYEQLKTEGPFIGATYLQYNICDFDLKLI